MAKPATDTTPRLETSKAGAPSDDLLEEIAETRERLRDKARATLGVTGTEEAPKLRSVVREYGLGFYTLSALGVLLIVDQFQGYAFSVLAPEIADALGIGAGSVAAVRSIASLASASAPLPMAALAQRRARRALLCLVTAVAWSIATLFSGFIISTAGLLLVLMFDGLTSGSAGTLHSPLLLDTYPPPARVRVLSMYHAFAHLGNIISPLLVAVLATYLGLTWRGVFVFLAIASFAGAAYALRLRDPGFGQWDTELLRQEVRELHGRDDEIDPMSEQDVALGFFEIVRRQLLIPTVRRLLFGLFVLGILLIPFSTILAFFLDERWNLGPGGRGVFYAFNSAVSITTLLLFGKRAEAMFRQDPARVVRLTGLALMVGVTMMSLGALSPVFAGMIVAFAIANGLVAVLSPAFGIALLSVVPARQRPHTSAILGIFVALGSLFGAFFLGGIEARFGTSGAIIALLIPGVIGSLIIASASVFVVGDLDRMIDEVLEEEEIKQIVADGGHLPMLSCRGIDFSYGKLQVLFDVNFTVDDGEMVALLGVNGAGKSTLLKVISGIGLPSAGTVRYRGQEVTYLDAERRVRIGITQVPGGRAVFGRASVVDNLRGFGYSLGRDRAAFDDVLDQCFEVFPRLAERRNQNASTLSGGEQQMLGLCKALILRPRLLLIDELSLGLAPVIVTQLLEMVRRINQTGTAVVLVEQSVNIALSVTEHAYFMEKGQIRFDGPSADLLARDDLLRAVFLEGASKGAGL